MIKIDVLGCTGYEIRQNICLDGFEVIEGEALDITEKADRTREAAEACPTFRGAEARVMCSGKEERSWVEQEEWWIL